MTRNAVRPPRRYGTIFAIGFPLESDAAGMPRPDQRINVWSNQGFLGG
jgi:hypothetical protein